MSYRVDRQTDRQTNKQSQKQTDYTYNILLYVPKCPKYIKNSK